MDPLQHLVGEWRVVTETWSQGDGEWKDSGETTAIVRPLLEGKILEETGSLHFIGQTVGLRLTFSWLGTLNAYRVSFIDGGSGMLDLYQGHLDEDGALLVDTKGSGAFTPWFSGDQDIYFRIQFSQGASERKVLAWRSFDGGESWEYFLRSTYFREG